MRRWGLALRNAEQQMSQYLNHLTVAQNFLKKVRVKVTTDLSNQKRVDWRKLATGEPKQQRDNKRGRT